ncbi:hypothetical protein GCM10011346_26160 [Oceanobacillus neutriphilus]|uniref:Uncharacterized protein n=1 Tax=Oceanobacillus neutriphilus TaxID=531815 RepID=A0ABQ2NW39_9BACI|nr:hypothetical protein GCM10011346_26160 [Oceanobacillus neutriphilus]
MKLWVIKRSIAPFVKEVDYFDIINAIYKYKKVIEFYRSVTGCRTPTSRNEGNMLFLSRRSNSQ